jgi:putative copper resistance protein D
VDGVLIACRFLHFSAAMLLFGSSAFARFVLPNAKRSGLTARASWPNGLLVLILAVTGLGWFALEAGNAGSGLADAVNPAMWAALASATSFGQVWVWHLAISLVLLVALVLPGKIGRPVLLIGSAGLLISLGLVGHAAMQQGAIGWEHRVNHMLHLLAAGFWVGALPPLLACLLALRTPQRSADASAALIRFSGLGHAAVAVTLVTGIINTALTLGGLPADLGSPYQSLLALKIVLVAIMLSIALCNRYVLTPRLAIRGLVIGTVAELLLGAAVIALVSAFATYDPV